MATAGTKTDRLAQFLLTSRVVASPVLRSRLGLQNVPDAIRVLRKRGHKIRTVMGSFTYKGIRYRRVAYYHYISFKKAK